MKCVNILECTYGEMNKKYVSSKHRSEILIQEQGVGKDVSKKKLQSDFNPHPNKTVNV